MVYCRCIFDGAFCGNSYRLEEGEQYTYQKGVFKRRT